MLSHLILDIYTQTLNSCLDGLSCCAGDNNSTMTIGFKVNANIKLLGHVV